MRFILFVLLAGAALWSQAPATPLVVDDAALGNDADGNNWLAFDRTYREQRFSRP